MYTRRTSLFTYLTSMTVLVIGAGTVSAAGSDAQDSLERLRDQFLQMGPIHQSWDFELSMPSAQVVQGRFNTWTDDEEYRYSVKTNLVTGLATAYEVAYNGARYQMFDSSTGVLSYQVADTRENPIGVPNPLLLPFDFLSIDDDGCDSCRFRLTDLDTQDIWDDRISQMTVLATSPDGLETVVGLPGGTIDGQSFSFRVVLSGLPGEQLPTLIERVTPAGVTLTSMTLGQYQTFSDPSRSGGVQIPTSVVISVRCGIEAAADPGVTVSYDLTTFDYMDNSNTTLILNATTINFARAISVWDSDAQVFVKEPQ